MYKIIYNKLICNNTYELLVEAPFVVEKCMPGQFVIVMPKEDSERIPLTIYDYDKKKGLLYLIYQVIGASTEELSTMKDNIFSVVGPLGNANEICANVDKFKGKRICYVAGGVGIAPVYPQVKFLVERGVKPTCIIGSRTKELLVYVDKFKALGVEVIVTTDDGTEGIKGPVTVAMKKLIEEDGRKFDRVVAIGPAIMMKFVCLLTKEYNIKTIVSMNTLMVDGTGMCGACRVKVGNETKFACVDGPEFDGHLIDFDEVMKRQSMYRDEEKRALLESEEKENGCGCSKKN